MHKECLSKNGMPLMIADGGFDYTPEGKSFMELPNEKIEYLTDRGMYHGSINLLPGMKSCINTQKNG